MKGASFDTLCKRTRYAGSRKARRAGRRIAMEIHPFTRIVLGMMAADVSRHLSWAMAFAGLRTTSAPPVKA